MAEKRSGARSGSASEIIRAPGTATTRSHELLTALTPVFSVQARPPPSPLPHHSRVPPLLNPRSMRITRRR